MGSMASPPSLPAAPGGSLDLTPLDLIPPRFYTRIALSFDISSEHLHFSSSTTVLAKFQAGLDETCRVLPWLGGNLMPVVSHASDGSIKSSGLQVQWQGHQVPAVQDGGLLPGSYAAAATEGMPLITIPNSKWPVPPMFTQEEHDAGKTPVMAASLISFEEGDGVILCVACHHNVVDAGGMAEILRIWAASTSGTSTMEKDKGLKGQEKEESRIGRLEQALDVESKHLQAANLQSLDQLLASHPEYTTKPVAFGTNAAGESPPPDFACEILSVILTKVEDLKAKLEPFMTPTPSTNTIISAVLWSAISRVRATPWAASNDTAPDTKTSHLGMAVNGRSRLSPTFHTDDRPYFGNLNLYARATLSVSQLCIPSSFSLPTNDTLQSLSQICTAIATSHSPSQISASRIAEIHALVAKIPRLPAVFPSWSPQNGHDVALTSWANLPLYNFSFGGGIGCPEFVRVPWMKAGDGLGIVLPRKREGRGNEVVEVVVMLKGGDLERLKEDEMWRMIGL